MISDSDVAHNVLMSSDTYRTVLPIVNEGDNGCIVHDLESILVKSYSHGLKALDRYTIFSATFLLQLDLTPSLMFILSLIKSHHIGDSTIFSMKHHMSSIATIKASAKELKCSCSNKVHMKSHSGPEPFVLIGINFVPKVHTTH